MYNKNEKTPITNRKYKDTMFRLLFKEKYAALSLYNALNGTAYEDESKLQIVTLENAIYINVKNDLAFVLDSNLNLYEHQSTYNPNMPLRELIYVSKEFQILADDKSLYSERTVTLPYPRFVVFYNGMDERPEKEIMKLSDLYDCEEDLKANPDLELKVIVLNINKGYNENLKEKCPLLMEYMEYVDKVRYYKEEKKLDLHDAVEHAINECIANGVLEAFLRKNRAEVMDVSIFEYNAEEEIRKYKLAQQELWKEQGLAQGRAEGRAAGAKQNALHLIDSFLKEYGGITEQLKERLENKDIETLNDLVQLASKAESLDQFVANL